MPTVNGTPVNFTFGSTPITLTNVTGALFQGIDFKKSSNRVLVKDQNGGRVTSAHADQIQAATVKWVVTGTSMAAALANTVLNAPGSYVVFTSCAAIPEIVTANKWEVISSSLPATNESVMEITLELELSTGIQTFPAT